MNKVFLMVLVAAAGVSQAVQSPLNGLLQDGWKNTWLAGCFISASSLIVFGLLFAIAGPPAPPLRQLLDIPWYVCLSSLLGCIAIYAMLTATQELGAGVFNSLLVTAAIGTSLALDHFGVFGLEQSSINLYKITGASLMIGGVLLIAKGSS